MQSDVMFSGTNQYKRGSIQWNQKSVNFGGEKHGLMRKRKWCIIQVSMQNVNLNKRNSTYKQ